MEWHALFVETGNEEKVKSLLEVKFEDYEGDISFVIPRLIINERRQGVWNEVVKKMLPGYLLIRGNIGIEEYYMFKGIPGVLKLLRSGGEFTPIPKREIEVLGTLLSEGDVIKPSTITFDEGDKVKVVDGPLKGLEGIIVHINKRKGRAKIKLDFLGGERKIDVGVNIIKSNDE